MIDVHDRLYPASRRMALTVVLLGWMSSAALPVYSQTSPQSSSLTQGGLTLEDRIGYQRAIEEVYWRHRIWPKENHQAKPALDDVMPLSAIRAKVEDYLRKSQALEVYWQRPITGEQLQAEMDRMSRQTKQPAMLQELWAALGNDPYVIAECLARPSLANRLIRNWYAHDERYHGELKRRAEADLHAYSAANQMRAMSGEYRELEWAKGETVGARHASPDAGSMTMGPEEWETKLGELAQLFGRGKEITTSTVASIYDRRSAVGTPPLQSAEVDSLPTGELSPLQEDDERFYVTAVLEKGNEHVKVATMEWKKEPFESWWKGGGQIGATHASLEQEARYAYRLAEMGAGFGGCVDDTWQPTLSPYPSRVSHTAVWTGTEMIVWGGFDFSSYFNTGGRYDPVTDTWTATATANAPSARESHTAVWTGSEMIVWGGSGPSGTLDTGGRYDPLTDTWTAPATANAPSARWSHTAVWTGTEMIVWAGSAGVLFNSGGRYDPATDTWTATATNNAPSARYQHTAVWTGSEMIIWGGYTGSSFFNTGGRYDPATDTWTATATNNTPSARSEHTAVWTGSEMIVWGGTGGFPAYFNTGGRYDPVTDTWTATATANAPSARQRHTAVWTGSEMIVWGGGAFPDFNTGGRYDPATDTWTATAIANAPSARERHTAAWTGSEMIVWGGDTSGSVFNTGGRYDPATDTWTATATNNAPSARSQHTAIWTGSEMIVWGGFDGTFLSSGGRYDPATDTWTATATTNAPSARVNHTAVWTGTEMIVWGGGHPHTTPVGVTIL